MPPLSRAVAKGRQLGGAFRGWQFGPLKIPENDVTHLKTVLTDAIQNTVNFKNQTLVLLWDELPMMLDNIRRKTNEDTAIELLNVFRAIRQQPHNKVRMVFTGSIGIHHILTKLKDTGYNHDSTNDMVNFELPVLTEYFSKELALKLLEGAQIQTDDPDSIAAEVASASCHVPFYIHHIVRHMKLGRNQIRAGSAAEIVQECINVDGG